MQRCDPTGTGEAVGVAPDRFHPEGRRKRSRAKDDQPVKVSTMSWCRPPISRCT
jgi:hypothetical protein